MKKNIYLLLLLLLSPLRLLADVEPSECDTLFTTDGKVYWVRIYDINQNQVEFSTCDAPDDERFTLSMTRVKRVGLNPQGMYTQEVNNKVDPLVKLAKKANNQAIIGAICVFLLSFLGVPALVFMILGIVNGEKALRLLDKQKDHPQASRIRKRSRTAVMVGMFSIIIPILIYLLLMLAL